MAMFACTGTHDTMEMISLCRRYAALSSESMHSSDECVVLVRARSQPSLTI